MVKLQEVQLETKIQRKDLTDNIYKIVIFIIKHKWNSVSNRPRI